PSQLAAGFTRAQDEIGTAAQAMGRALHDAIMGAVNALAQGIEGLINGTMRWGQALRAIEGGVLKSIGSALAKMIADLIAGIVLAGIKFVITHTVMPSQIVQTWLLGLPAPPHSHAP